MGVEREVTFNDQQQSVCRFFDFSVLQQRVEQGAPTIAFTSAVDEPFERLGKAELAGGTNIRIP